MMALVSVLCLSGFSLAASPDNTKLPGAYFRLLEAGAAIRCNNLPAAAWKIATLFEQPEKLRAMKQAARAMAHPDAARVIAQDALGLLH